MPDYLTGYEVVKLLDIETFELVRLVKNGLTPHNRFGHKVCDKKVQIKYQTQYILGRRLFKLESKLEWAKEELRLLEQNTDEQSLLCVKGILTGLPKLEAKISDLKEKGIKPFGRIYGTEPEKIFPNELKGCHDWEYFDLPSDKNEAKRIIKRFLNFLYPKSDVENLKKTMAGRILKEGNLAKESLPIDSNTDNSISEEEVENIVRNFVFAYEDNEQISIKAPKLPKKLFTANSLGFKNTTVKTWKQLILILKNPEHTYYVGEAGEKNNINKEYSRKLALLKDMCKRISQFIAQEFSLSLPKNFKLYERAKGEKPGTYTLKIRIKDDNEIIAEKSNPYYDKMSEEELLKKMAFLKVQSEELQGSENYGQKGEIDELLSDLYTYATEIRKISPGKFKEILK